MGKWYLHPKWLRFLPAAILFKLQQKRYACSLLYEDATHSFQMLSKDPFWSQDPRDERIAYLEKVISDNAMVIMANECSKESQ